VDRERDDDRPHGLDIVAAIAGDGNWGINGGPASQPGDRPARAGGYPNWPGW
jgi:hypothetical protein